MATSSQPAAPINSLWRSTLSTRSGKVGVWMLAVVLGACVLTLPWTLGTRTVPGTAHRAEGSQRVGVYEAQDRPASRLPPILWGHSDDQQARLDSAAREAAIAARADAQRITIDQAAKQGVPSAAELDAARPRYLLGTDMLGRDLLPRLLLGGAISLGVGLAAACISVVLGTLYGAVAGYLGGRVDAVMMRVVDVLYGLPYVLLVVLLAVAADAMVDEYVSRSGARWRWTHDQSLIAAASNGFEKSDAGIEKLKAAQPAVIAEIERRASDEPSLQPREMNAGARGRIALITLLVAIGGVSWLTLSRVVRGQVMALKEMPFVEAARAMGATGPRIFFRHLLPNLVGPIVVYATLTVPQAILQESFLSFLGIGVKPPMPSLGNLAADGLPELNMVQSHWWLLVFPCLVLVVTLVGLNMLGEGLRVAIDPKAKGGRS